MTTGFMYGQFNLNRDRALVPDLAAGGTTVNCALMLATYVPNQDTDVFWDDISTYEHAATGGYAAAACGTKTVTYASKLTTFDLANPYWASVVIANVRYLVFKVDTGVASTSPLIVCFDLGTAITQSSPGPLSFNVSTLGLYGDLVA
jgi:hypothetical protein